MEQFATEEQQVEAIKKFWKENGPAIVIGAVLGLGGLWGWRYYNDTQIAAQEQASSAYEQVVSTLESDAETYTKAGEFVTANSDSGYALLTAFQMAKQAVERKDLPEAAKQLTYVANNAEDSTIKSIANLRLARIQIEQEQLDAAIATLDSINDEAFTAQVQEVKGDAYVKQELFDKARAAYSASLEANDNNPLLKMKLDNLAVAANG